MREKGISLPMGEKSDGKGVKARNRVEQPARNGKKQILDAWKRKRNVSSEIFNPCYRLSQ